VITGPTLMHYSRLDSPQLVMVYRRIARLDKWRHGYMEY